MKKLDRYIARQYLVNVLALLLLLISLIIAIDVVLNLDRFLDAGAERADESGSVRHFVTTALWVIDLWGPRALQLYNYLIGMVLVLAMGFTCAQLVRRRELVAAIASGISLQRLAAPFLLVALGATGVQAVNQELFLPAVAPLLTRSAGDALARELRPFETPLVPDGQNRLWYAREFRSNDQTLHDVVVWERDEAGRVLRRITASGAAWNGSGWTLQDGRATRLEGASAGRPEPIDAIDSSLDPTILVAKRFESYGDNLSWRQIGRALQRPEGVPPQTRDRLERVRYGRLSTMVSNLLALVIALPFFLVREPRNMAAQTIKAAPVVGVALIAASIGPAAQMPGLPAQLGVFVPAMLLAPLALAAAVSVRT